MSSKVASILKNPRLIYPALGQRGFFHWLNDEAYLKKCFKAYMGYELNLENPRTFNEKLQWLKLHDRNPLYTTLVDKIAVKDWVAERIGREHIIPTYAVWDSVDDIDIDALPEKFVLKTNHDSGGIAICRDRASFDFAAAKRKLSKSLGRSFYWGGREWPYKNVVPRVLAEEYLELSSDDAGLDLPVGLVDYKFYCFDGEPMFLYVSKGLEKHSTARISFLSLDWEFMPFWRSDYSPFEELPSRPESYGQMIDMAHVLASGIPFVRVDMYEKDGVAMFSEMTFNPCSGFMPFHPFEWDAKVGLLFDEHRRKVN